VEEHLELIVEAKPRGTGASGAIAVSLVLHVVIAFWIARHYHPVTSDAQPAQSLHYVELMRQAPKDFTEAPGQKVEKAPLNAPFSDENRRASMPDPTGNTPATRPGENNGLFTPPMPAGEGRRPEQTRPEINQPQVAPAQTAAAAQPSDATPPQPNGQSQLIYRQQEQRQQEQKPVQANAGAVDWRNAIRSVGSASSPGSGPEGIDLNKAGGGEKGFAENGPLSFETQWYDWGDYAQSMVSRIRVNWYAQMPPLIKTGMKGVVTIRFTIQRSGRISDIEMLDSSGVPPYDFAAKKAIELSTPLNPLPKDFPKESERVTCMFYYNQEVPSR
jgi:TonB family protein